MTQSSMVSDSSCTPSSARTREEPSSAEDFRTLLSIGGSLPYFNVFSHQKCPIFMKVELKIMYRGSQADKAYEEMKSDALIEHERRPQQMGSPSKVTPESSHVAPSTSLAEITSRPSLLDILTGGESRATRPEVVLSAVGGGNPSGGGLVEVTKPHSTGPSSEDPAQVLQSESRIAADCPSSTHTSPPKDLAPFGQPMQGSSSAEANLYLIANCKFTMKTQNLFKQNWAFLQESLLSAKEAHAQGRKMIERVQKLATRPALSDIRPGSLRYSDYKYFSISF
ncbi:unnamed protein product [Cuscuta campestris]|uniref:Uncharacterized protein n=1 Tax=Cuscuta campestris TaxID=132261 RepID=A0A484LJ87_9ASTE|nr:unnamed protein product [Cuscuta campestris]